MTLAALLATAGWLVVGESFSRVVAVLWRNVEVAGTLGSAVLFLPWSYVNG